MVAAEGLDAELAANGGARASSFQAGKRFRINLSADADTIVVVLWMAAHVAATHNALLDARLQPTALDAIVKRRAEAHGRQSEQ